MAHFKPASASYLREMTESIASDSPEDLAAGSLRFLPLPCKSCGGEGPDGWTVRPVNSWDTDWMLCHGVCFGCRSIVCDSCLSHPCPRTDLHSYNYGLCPTCVALPHVCPCTTMDTAADEEDKYLMEDPVVLHNALQETVRHLRALIENPAASPFHDKIIPCAGPRTARAALTAGPRTGPGGAPAGPPPAVSRCDTWTFRDWLVGEPLTRAGLWRCPACASM